ncbi:phage major capsid protein [Azohydromonas sp.]|uniref:phage major capsid protein n=1 Tax=Azohydromonas sp. TaxID=1872666 RepID=UPI002C03F813|nr:phage major capsid protein [Azohydromonas sp.]HMM85344.1 phage major capsid protein [Azohydromonas sp.]
MMQREHLPQSGFLDLTVRQASRYSLGELIRAAAHDDKSVLPFYREISEAIAAKTGQQPTTFRSFYIPNDVLVRDMTASGSSGSNYLVGTQNAGFAGALFATSITARLPLRRAQLTGNGTIAAVTTAPTVAWLSDEATQAPDGAPVVGQRSMTPKTIATTQFVSKQFDLQSPGAISFVEQQMGAALAKAVDVAFISGGGSGGEPLGLLQVPNTVSQSGTTLAYSGVCTMIAAAEGYGGAPVAIMGVDVARLLRQRAKITSGEPIYSNGKLDGLDVFVSRAAPDDAMVLLDPTLIAEARWGTVEVTISPLASPTAFRYGGIGVRLMLSIDWAVDHPSTIAKSTSIT